MKICPICKGAINKGQQIAVASAPLQAIDNNAGYSIMSDFIDKEIVTHNKCFLRYAPAFGTLMSGAPVTEEIKPKKNENKIAPLSTVAVDLREALSALGEKVPHNEIQTFLIQNNSVSEVGELVTLWFKKRNRLI